MNGIDVIMAARRRDEARGELILLSALVILGALSYAICWWLA